MYKLKNIFLIESSFKRIEVLSTSENIEQLLDFKIDTINLESSNFNVILNADFVQPGEQGPEVEIKVKMVGHFEKEGETESPPLDYFTYVNAPAMLYPFVREHIASLTAKAGMDTALLPPFNFVEMYNRRKTEEEAKQQEESPTN